jgi:hypothetical protein
MIVSCRLVLHNDTFVFIQYQALWSEKENVGVMEVCQGSTLNVRTLNVERTNNQQRNEKRKNQ